MVVAAQDKLLALMDDRLACKAVVLCLAILVRSATRASSISSSLWHVGVAVDAYVFYLMDAYLGRLGKGLVMRLHVSGGYASSGTALRIDIDGKLASVGDGIGVRIPLTRVNLVYSPSQDADVLPSSTFFQRMMGKNRKTLAMAW